MLHNKDEVISFKVGAALARVIRRLPNRSEFIRAAVLSALDHACPLCQGTGLLCPRAEEALGRLRPGPHGEALPGLRRPVPDLRVRLRGRQAMKAAPGRR